MIVIQAIIICLLLFTAYMLVTVITNILKYTNAIPSNLQKLVLPDDLDQVKSGDIFLTRYIYTSIPNIAILSTFFSHVGIVVELNGIKYVLEITGPTDDLNADTKKGRTTVIPLMSRIAIYNGDSYIMSLQDELSSKQLAKLQYHAKLVQDNKTDFEYEENIFRLLSRIVFPFRFSYTNLVCTEYLSHILKSIELTDYLEMSKIHHTGTKIMNLPNIQLTGGNRYTTIKQLIYDI